MTREELEMRTLIRESDVIDRTDGSELAKAFNYLWEKYVEQEPCDDAISRQAVLDVVDSYSVSQSNVEDVTQDIISDIVVLPSVKQEPETGHWIWELEDWNKWICSECGWSKRTDVHVRLGYDFCPSCGAKMVEPESEHKCHTCKHYTSGERDGSCGSYICKHYSNWESEE